MTATGLSDDCGATGSATVTFTATDAVETRTTTATFTIEDTTAPSIGLTAADLIALFSVMEWQILLVTFTTWLASNGGATASDAVVLMLPGP